ncbi:MAG: glycosyltransferase [Bacteroidales bacterium]|nr:glycosyltransferase [Bacteroidales bacterium]
MSTTPRITVITVTFNNKPQLISTMQSVDIQDYDNLEYIVVDGNSSDGTADALKSYAGKLDKWVSEPDRGIYDAMNKGVGLSTGDYCIFMNAGDTFVKPTTISDIVNCGFDSDVVYGNILKNGKLVEASAPRNCHKMYYCHQAVFVKTACLREFPFDISHKMSADFKQAKLLYLAGKSIKQTNITVANFDTNGISNTKRSTGLMDNIKVIREVDKFKDKLRMLPRLYFTYIWCKMRGK